MPHSVWTHWTACLPTRLSFRGSATLGLTLALLAPSVMSHASPAPDHNGAPIAVNIGVFSGDESLAHAVSETLLTDLAKSDRLALLDERSANPDTRRDAAFTLTGSCLVYDNSVVINIRLVDSSTGRTVPGAAENIDGPRSQVFTLVHSLANKLTARLTNQAFVAPAETRRAETRRSGSGNLNEEGRSVEGSGRGGDIILPSLPRVSTGGISPDGGGDAPGGGGDAPSSNRASHDRTDANYDARNTRQAEGRTGAQSEERTGRNGDESGARVDINTLPGENRRDSRVDSRGESDAPVQTRRERAVHTDRIERRDRTERYTSVIIDARGLGLERSMSPRLRGADNSVLWTGGEATPDFVIEQGIVTYANTLREAREQDRAGSNPLILTAVGRYEQPFPSDPQLSEEDADYLLRMNRRDGFLRKYHVIFVIGR